MEKKETLKRIERYLYERRYATTYQGRYKRNVEWATLYYGIFQCRLKNKRRTFPLGPYLDGARDQLQRLVALNVDNHDFDKKEFKGITLATYSERYLDLVKSKRSLNTDKIYLNHLKQHLGMLSLSEISRTRIMEYKNIRLTEPIIRQGKPVEGTRIKASTINREISCLLYLLRLAADETPPLLESLPRFPLDSEGEFARTRILTPKEYQDLLDNSPRWLQRVFIGANEACLSRGDLLGLTWDSVDREKGAIQVYGGRIKTRVQQVVPISPDLWAVLDELKEKPRDIRNTENLVFTKSGQRINKDTLRFSLEQATEKAGIQNFRLHDFRHCAQTRWTLAGIPEGIQNIAAGHKPRTIHSRYVNPPVELIVESFIRHLYWNFEKVRKAC